MKIATINVGFIEVPNQISLNLYAQGCKKRCKDCHNPELQTFEGGTDIDLEQFKNVLKNHRLPKWICWIGGDAVYQPKDLKLFSKTAQKSGFKVCLYTGLNFEEVYEQDLLDDVDLVMDGEYEEELGSIDKETTNQRCFLRYNKKGVGVVWNKFKFKDLKEEMKSKLK